IISRKIGLLALSVALVIASAALAKSIYKYRDENGNWHFTDQPPQTAAPVTRMQVDVEPDARVVVHKRGTARSPEYVVYNGYHGPVEVSFTFDEASNVRSEPPLPHRLVVPPQREVRAFGVTARDGRRAWSYTFRYSVTPGDPGARHDGTLYLPPFAAGSRFPVTQSFFGPYSHTDPQSAYAVDIAMPVGTPVRAARGGVVMDVNRDFFGTGTDLKKYGQRANTVRILHDDGTMAIYAHLKLESVLVIPGARVRAGQVIAASGNTGFSTGPHLHFAVQRNDRGTLVSVPFAFKSATGHRAVPNEGDVLSAY
ncbi:MAG TPA: DUF4124 domain-containing protein, partial [Gammaproteobacteria bacterium]|nr:DUF4124 domain-containing protein [Gammaproteobacteria bacterium]